MFLHNIMWILWINFRITLKQIEITVIERAHYLTMCRCVVEIQFIRT